MSLIAELAPILFLAAALGLLAARLSQPPLLGCIIAGIIALTALGVGHGDEAHLSIGAILFRPIGFVAACASLGLAVGLVLAFFFRRAVMRLHGLLGTTIRTPRPGRG